MSRYFLGTNYGHGSSAALLDQTGKIIFAVEEERLNRQKGTDEFPFLAIQKNLESHNGIVWLAEGWKIYRRVLYKGIWASVRYGFFNPYYFKNRFLKEIKRTTLATCYFPWLILSKKIKKNQFIGHHLSHAYSLLPWGIPDNTLIFVSDALAEKETISVYVWANNFMHPIAKSYYPNSIGSFFHQLAYHLGFRGRTGPGKLMALSSWGEPTLIEELFSLSEVRKGYFSINKRYQPWRVNKTWLNFARHKSCPGRLKSALLCSYKNYEEGVDLAASMQEWFTETTYQYISQSIKYARETLGLKVHNLGLAGGAALNCQTNGELVRRLDSLDLQSLFVSPWPDDSGTAIGAAAFAVHANNTGVKFPKSSPFLGPCLNNSDLYLDKKSTTDLKEAIRVLVSGNIIALASGRMEFGPRALGGRCLLGDARFHDVKDKLNNMKSRPAFMPFAPVALEEDFDNFFYGTASSNMAWTVKAKPIAHKVIPAAVHKSGESRVQIVSKDNDLLIRRLIKYYKEITGIGVLLLTSLNGKNEPIACSLDDCISVARRMKCHGILTDAGWKAFTN